MRTLMRTTTVYNEYCDRYLIAQLHDFTRRYING